MMKGGEQTNNVLGELTKQNNDQKELDIILAYLGSKGDEEGPMSTLFRKY